MNNYEVTITWSAFGNPTSATITLNAGCDIPDTMVCEAVFHDTNLYTGSIWDKLQPVIPPNRTHTALSVGDTVSVDGRVYLCASEGWTPLPSQQDTLV